MGPHEEDKKMRRIAIAFGGIIVLLLLVMVVLCVLFLVQTKSSAESADKQSKYAWRGCSKLGKCSRSDFVGRAPPLVLISLDGFAREYLERRIIKSFDYFAECGVKAEKVFPTFPSRTFVNHYTMVTGLYPVNHGVVDNYVYDPAISREIEDMKRVNNSKILNGFPIWSVYKKETGGKTACLMYPLSMFDNTGYPADIAPKYNQDIPFRNRFELIVDWLKKEPSERPGVISVYLHQPDLAGHYQKNKSDVDELLQQLDTEIDRFLQLLHDENILECINLVLFSDHGMSLLNNTYYYDQMFEKLNNMVTVNGVVGRIHLNGSNQFGPAADVQTTAAKNKLLQQKIKRTRVWTRDDIPPRKHYDGSDRVGDIILEGLPGTVFFRNSLSKQEEKDLPHSYAEHGYDYIYDEMQTIFFARGPSLKPKKVLPAFQNIEFMNLWMDLLELKQRIPTDGTDGLFDDVLVKAPTKKINKPEIKECVVPPSKMHEAKLCYDCKKIALEVELLTQKLKSCVSLIPPLVDDKYVCSKNYCENSIVAHGDDEAKDRMLFEFIAADDVMTKPRPKACRSTWENTKYNKGSVCGTAATGTPLAVPLSSKSEFYYVHETVQQQSFSIEGETLDLINNATLRYLKQHKKLLVMTGTKTDRRKIFANRNYGATSFFRVLVACDDGWSSTVPGRCEKPERLTTIAFLLPTLADLTKNRLTADEFLLEYTARLRDIELLTDVEFRFDGLDFYQNLRERVKITTQLW